MLTPLILHDFALFFFIYLLVLFCMLSRIIDVFFHPNFQQHLENQWTTPVTTRRINASRKKTRPKWLRSGKPTCLGVEQTLSWLHKKMGGNQHVINMYDIAWISKDIHKHRSHLYMVYISWYIYIYSNLSTCLFFDVLTFQKLDLARHPEAEAEQHRQERLFEAAGIGRCWIGHQFF